MLVDAAIGHSVLLLANTLVSLALWLLWPMAGLYFGLCIGIPEIRPYWKGGNRFELFSCLGCAITCGGTWLLYASIITGLLGEGFYRFLYPVGLLGVAIAILGGWIEAAEEESDRNRRARRFKK